MSLIGLVGYHSDSESETGNEPEPDLLPKPITIEEISYSQENVQTTNFELESNLYQDLNDDMIANVNNSEQNSLLYISEIPPPPKLPANQETILRIESYMSMKESKNFDITDVC
jgi:hypothetical protein